MANELTLTFSQVGLEAIESAASLTTKALNKLQDVSKGVSSNIKGLGDKVKAVSFNDAIKGVKSFSTALGSGVATAAKTATTAMSGVVSGVGKAAKGITTALGPVASVITGVNQGIELCKKAFEKLQNIKGLSVSKDIETITGGLKEAATFASKVMAAFAAPALQTFAKTMSNIKALFSDTSTIDKFAKAIGTVQAVISVVWDLFYGFYQDLKDAVMPVIDAVKEKFTQLNERFGIINKAIGIVTNTWQYFINNLTNGLEVIGKLLKGDVKGAVAAAGNAVKEAVTGVVDIFTTAEEKGQEVVNKFTEKQSEYSSRAKEILKENTATATEESEKTLAQRLKDLQEYIAFEKKIVEMTETNEEAKAEKLKSLDQSYYSQKLSLEKNAYKTIIENNGKISDKSISSMSSLSKQIADTTKELNKFNKEGKDGVDVADDLKKAWLQAGQSIASSFGSLASTITGAWSSFSKVGQDSITEYENAITAAQERLDAMLEEFDARQAESAATTQETTENDREIRIANLEAEMERSIAANDQMSAKAIAIKLKQLKKEKEAEDKAAAEEQARADAELAAEEERNRIKAQGEYEVALATYNKDLAEYNNNVAEAQQTKNIAIANATIDTAKAIAAGALGIATTFGQGGVFMLPAAIAASVGVISAAVSGIAGVTSAASALDSAKSDPPTAPTPPQFAIGTGGYDLSNNGWAVVGEQGPELVRQKYSGDLEVVSNSRARDFDGNGNTTNIINLYVSELVDENALISLLNKMKNRGFAYNV